MSDQYSLLNLSGHIEITKCFSSCSECMNDTRNQVVLKICIS